MQTLSELIPQIHSLGRREAIRDSAGYSTRIRSYAELHGMIGACTRYLDDEGLSRGDRVIIHAENCSAWVALFWACVARGIHVVPIDFNFSADLVSRIRADCDARRDNRAT